MKITRRTFLGTAPILAGAALHFQGVALGQSKTRSGLFPVPAVNDALAQLSWESFLPFIGTDFTFGQGGNAVSLKFADMKDSIGAHNVRRRGGENFVLKFQGPFDRVLRDGTYQVNHFRLGDFELFITNGGKVRREQYYIAVINRTTK